MTTATWNGTVLAESDDIVTVEGNAYFPRESVREDVLPVLRERIGEDAVRTMLVDTPRRYFEQAGNTG